jgi:hypothetical protein
VEQIISIFGEVPGSVDEDDYIGVGMFRARYRSTGSIGSTRGVDGKCPDPLSITTRVHPAIHHLTPSDETSWLIIEKEMHRTTTTRT